MPNIPPFDPHSDPTSLGTRWQKWVRRFQDAMIGFDITSEKRQRALLLHFGGEELEDIFDTLENTGADDKIKPAIDALTTYFTPKKNTVFESIIFRDAVQEEDESVDQFCTRLRKLAKKCDFADTEREIQIQILAKCRSDYLRKRALEKERSLSDLLELARTIELSETRAKRISAGAMSVSSSTSETVSKLTDQSTRPKQARTPRKDSQRGKLTCYRCGFDYPHENRCPAEGKECRSCGLMNHFARCCRNSASVSSRTHTKENMPQKGTHTKENPGNQDYTGKSQNYGNVKSLDQAEQTGQSDNSEEYVFSIVQDSHKRDHTLDTNTYQREAVDKKSQQSDSSNQNSHQR